MSSSSSAARNAAPPPPEVTTEPTASDQEIARLRERVKELEARLAPPEPRTATNDQPQFSSIVLFGADGNLATKKTFPTLFALWRKKLLPRDIVIIGYAREAMDTESFRKNVVRSRRPAVPSRRRRASCPSSDEVGGFCFDSEAVRTAFDGRCSAQVYKAIYSSAHAQRERRRFLQRVHYCSGQFDDASHVRERLAPLLEKRAAASADASRRRRRGDGTVVSTQARGQAGPRRLRVGRRAPPAPRRPEPRGLRVVGRLG